jgi:hypothetical protein
MKKVLKLKKREHEVDAREMSDLDISVTTKHPENEQNFCQKVQIKNQWKKLIYRLTVCETQTH